MANLKVMWFDSSEYFIEILQKTHDFNRGINCAKCTNCSVYVDADSDGLLTRNDQGVPDQLSHRLSSQAEEGGADRTHQGTSGEHYSRGCHGKVLDHHGI